MKRLLVLVIILSINGSITAGSADTVELHTLYKSLLMKHPLSEQPALLRKAAELSMENIKAAYLPQLNISAQASYQSDVTEVQLAFPENSPFSSNKLNMPEIQKDMYKAYMEVNQLIYDGGLSESLKEQERASLQAEQKEVDVEFYNLKRQLNQLYFSVLLLSKQKEQMLLKKRDIASRLENIRSAVQGGTMLKSNAQELEAELLKIDQQVEILNASHEASINTISHLTGKMMPVTIEFKLPTVDIKEIEVGYAARPEISKIRIQREKLGISRQVLKAKKRPRLVGFGQAGYGRPGLNMLSDEFDSFYLLGAKMQWNAWDWHQNKNERRKLELQSAILDNRIDVMETRFEASLKPVLSDMEKYNSLLEKDEEIIRLREEIVKSAKSQLENGSITSTEYIIKLNAENQAKLEQELHRIQLAYKKLQYLEITGQLDKIIK